MLFNTFFDTLKALSPQVDRLVLLCFRICGLLFSMTCHDMLMSVLSHPRAGCALKSAMPPNCLRLRPCLLMPAFYNQWPRAALVFFFLTCCFLDILRCSPCYVSRHVAMNVLAEVQQAVPQLHFFLTLLTTDWVYSVLSSFRMR